MYGDYFHGDAGLELDAVKQLVKEKGEDGARQMLEDHWNNYVSKDDWDWLASKGVTAVRIPIGYWAVGGGRFAEDTNFEKIAKVYRNAWDAYKKLIQEAAEHNIGVLVDLHAVPKAANTGDHSGEVVSKAGFWDSSSSHKKLCEVVKFMAQDVHKLENVVGIQIVNESEFSNDASGQKRYYSKAISAIREVDSQIPIVISDGWWPDQWVKWVASQESKLGDYQFLGVVIDSHCYRCFSDNDKGKSPEQIINDLKGDLLTNLSSDLDILVGEYSCVLDGQSWDKTQKDRSQLVSEYGQAQIREFRQKANCGSYFWTFKFQYGDGGEWGFKPMVESNSIPARSKSVKVPDKKQFEDALNAELSGHENYWNQQNSHEKYEHDRFKEGFTTAWADCSEFAKFDGSRLGRLHAWSRSRLQEHVKARGNSRFIWEWEQGFNKGVEIFNRTAFGD